MAEGRIADQLPRPHDQGVDVDILVASLRLVGRQTVEHRPDFAVQRVALLAVQLIGDRDDIGAAIAVCRKGEFPAATFQIAQPCTDRQDLHLASGIVDVVLAAHVVADRLQQVGDRCAERRMPPMADVQRPGRVRGDEFHQYAAPTAQLRPSVSGTFIEDAREFAAIGVRLDEEIQKAGAGDLDPLDGLVRRHCGQQGLGELARILARGLGELHGQVTGEVAVLRVASAFDFDAERTSRGRHHLIGQRLERRPQQFFDQDFHRGGSLPWRRPRGLTLLDLERIDVDRPAQTRGTRKRLDHRQPARQEALQTAARRRLDEHMRPKVIGAARHQRRRRT